MENSVLKSEINKAIKSIGLTNKDVTVLVKTIGGTNTSVKVKAKHYDLNFAAIQAAVEVFEKYNRCELTGDILSGGNTFVDVYNPNNTTCDWSRR